MRVLSSVFMYSRRLIFGTCVAVVWRISSAWSQEAAQSNPTQLTPSWETQRQAATYALGIPAPRGQITDRNGVPLAQNRVGFNLAIEFPTPLKFTDQQALEFTHEQIGIARGIINRHVDVSDDDILKHYRNRGMLPMEISLDLLP